MLRGEAGLKARYLLFWPEAPKTGNITKDKILVAYSFGRNSFSEREVKIMIYGARENARGTGDAFRILKEILAFESGNPNSSIASECAEIIKEHGIKNVILSWEIAFSLWENDRKLFYQVNPSVIWPDDSKARMSTREISLKVAEIIREKKGKEIVLVAHKRLSARAALLLKRALQKEADIAIPEIKTGDFDERSAKWQTQGAFKWLTREILTRIHHLLLGWV